MGWAGQTAPLAVWARRFKAGLSWGKPRLRSPASLCLHWESKGCEHVWCQRGFSWISASCLRSFINILTGGLLDTTHAFPVLFFFFFLLHPALCVLPRLNFQHYFMIKRLWSLAGSGEGAGNVQSSLKSGRSKRQCQFTGPTAVSLTCLLLARLEFVVYGWPADEHRRNWGTICWDFRSQHLVMI